MTTDEQKYEKCKQIHALCNMLCLLGYGKVRFAPIETNKVRKDVNNESKCISKEDHS